MPGNNEETKDNQFVVGRTEKMLSQTGQNKTASDVSNAPLDPYARNQYTGGEFPRRKPPYILAEPHAIQPGDHTLNPPEMERDGDNLKNTDYFVQSPASHFIRDVHQHLDNRGSGEAFSDQMRETTRQSGYLGVKDKFAEVPVFSGATTNINPYNDPTTKAIHENGGLSKYIEETNASEELAGKTDTKPPISPLHPFNRMNDIKHPSLADGVLFNSYNRTKTPIADIEWRKGFRHIFITRPELYVMANEDGTCGLCEQTEWDDDFASAYIRMPHIIRTLAPWYVSGSSPKNMDGANWNFLLSNRAQGLSVAPTTMSINENVSKSLEGFTVTTAMHVESRQGSTLDITFKDTKYLEVYEMARLWMLYMYKRKKGIFLPPYNGYQKHNGFPVIGTNAKKLSGNEYTRFHPFDNAIEYGASIYDIITNEAGTRILYWCKYYGVYPTSVSPSLNNENNGAITDMTCSITFKYHYRLENNNRSLVEFNHDAGLLDDIGKPKGGMVKDSLPFLLLNEKVDPVMRKGYLGAAGMFTGSPYIVMSKRASDPLENSKSIYTPELRFMGLDNDGFFNIGIKNETDIDISNIIVSD